MPTIQTITNPSGTFPYVPTTRTLTINGIGYDLTADRSWTISTSGTGTVTSVALSATMPTGLVASISGSPITSNGTLGLTITMQSGYAIPTTAKQSQWDSAYSFTSTFPSGTALQLLRVNSFGTAYEFFTPTYLVPSDIIATSPLVWNSGTKTISIPKATGTVDGYLAAADFITFGNKQDYINLTTTGNSGSATFVGSTLNIPTYTLAGLGGLGNPFTGVLGQMIYSNAAGAPLNIAPNTTTTKKYLSMTGDGTNGDQPFWDTIPASIGGSGTTGYIPRFTASGTIGDSIIAQGSGIINIYGVGQVYTSQFGAGQSLLYVSNEDVTAGINHQTILATQQLGSGFARTLLYAAAYGTNKNRGELSILNENGANFLANFGTQITGGDNAFSLWSTSNVENIRLNTGGSSYLMGGNLGIGTITTTNKVDIATTNRTSLTASGSGLNVNYNGSTTGQYQSIGFSWSGSIGNLNTYWGMGFVGTNFSSGIGSLIFFNGGTEYIRLTNNGYVGIGTQTPATNLVVASSGESVIRTQDTDGTNQYIDLAHNGGTSYFLSRNNTTNGSFIWYGFDGSVTTEYIRLNTNGNLGINQNNPTEKLDVVGNIKLSGYVTGGSWQGNAVYPAYGGTGATSLTGVVIGNGTSSMTAVAGTASQLLRRNASNTDYEFFTHNFITNPMTSLGDMIYGNAVGLPLRLGANTSTTKKFLAAQGDGTNGDAPFWETINASTIGALSSVGIAVPTGFSVSNSPLTANGTITIGFASGYALPTTTKQSEWDSAYTNRITNLTTTGSSGAASLISNTLNIPNYTLAGLGGMSNPMTGANGAGDMIYSNGAGAPLRLAPNTTTTKKYLSMTGDGTNGDAPFWDTITGFTGTGTTNYITKFTSSSAIGNSLLYDSGVRVSIGNASPQRLFHLAAQNGATIIRMENTDTTVSIGETIGAIEFYGNDTAAGVGGIIDAYGGGLTGEVNIDIFAGTNGNLVGGITAKYTGAINFTPLNAAPSPASAGDVYYDSSTNKLRCYDGTSWNDLF